MNTNWRNRPTTIDEIPTNINWLISIDESGCPDLKQVQKAKNQGLDIDEGNKQFTVTACAIKVNDFITIQDQVMTIKNKYWKDAIFNYNGIEKRVCFHSREIRSKRGAFNPTIIDYPAFITDLSDMIKNIPIKLFASNIDKWKHINKYTQPIEPYNLCMNFVLERIMRHLHDDETCYIVLESRGKKEDSDLLSKIKGLIDNGNSYNTPSFFKKIKGVYFNPKWCQIANNKKSYWSLELADLCAFPIHKYLTYGAKDRAFEILKSKIYGYPQIMGKGLKSFPQ